uniref:Uncharacterized protein n=1 Tax=Echeneis naucrates TaxID=173247 RepID=A0A665UGZ2_ECHNA
GSFWTRESGLGFRGHLNGPGCMHAYRETAPVVMVEKGILLKLAIKFPFYFCLSVGGGEGRVHLGQVTCIAGICVHKCHLLFCPLKTGSCCLFHETYVKRN